MALEQKKNFIIQFIYIVFIFVILWFISKYVISWLMPFILAFLIASLLQGVIKKITKQFKLKRNWVSIIVLALFYVIAATLIILGLVKITNLVISLLKELPNYYSESINPIINQMIDQFEATMIRFNPEFKMGLIEIDKQIFDVIKSLAPRVSQLSISFALFIPSFIVTSLIMIISSFFITIDYDNISSFLYLQMSPRTKELVVKSKFIIGDTIVKFIRSYGMIMFITFIELSIGFSILKIPNAIAIALVIAIFDILPVLGTGGIMIPWILISLINGDVTQGLGLLAVYGFVTVVRNVIEPKIVGSQVGAHPLVMLISMVVGIKIMGGIGILVLPIIVILIKNLNEEGVIHLYKTKKDTNEKICE